MQQLIIEHNSNNSNQKIVSGEKTNQNQQKLEVENKREDHGRNIALTRNVFRLQNTDTYYAQSESVENIYYCVRYNFGVLEWCSCPDNSIRGIKCKHQFAIEYAIKLGTLKDIEKLPINAKKFTNHQEISVVQQSNQNHGRMTNMSSSILEDYNLRVTE
ncbi:MAG: SWIM zinc finger family protein [Nitrososphaeraceae archaeon]